MLVRRSGNDVTAHSSLGLQAFNHLLVTELGGRFVLGGVKAQVQKRIADLSGRNYLAEKLTLFTCPTLSKHVKTCENHFKNPPHRGDASLFPSVPHVLLGEFLHLELWLRLHQLSHVLVPLQDATQAGRLSGHAPFFISSAILGYLDSYSSQNDAKRLKFLLFISSFIISYIIFMILSFLFVSRSSIVHILEESGVFTWQR